MATADKIADVIVFANHKGGVGKTSLAVSTADALARDGFEVLLVDLDPQANATQLLYSFDSVPSITIEKVLDGSANLANAIIEETRVSGVHLIGSTLKLASLERQLLSTPYASTALLYNKLKPILPLYDIVIIDTPPALSYLTANALSAGDFVFVPIESGNKLALMGAEDMKDFIAGGREANSRLKLGGAVLTCHDGRKKVCQLTAVAVGDYYDAVCETMIPQSVDMQKAHALGKTPLQLDRDSPTSKAIVALAREIEHVAGLKPKKKGGSHE
jgi:chromosome partitioning protein